MSRGEDNVRAAIAGADRALTVIDGGKAKRPPDPPAEGQEKPCPVQAIGHIDGRYVFLDSVGQKRELSAKSLGSRHDLLSLFGHDDSWLRWRFPKQADVIERDENNKVKKGPDNETITRKVTVDFVINAAAGYLGELCFRAGLFGRHINLRRPGVWLQGESGIAVHCGDMVLVGAGWQDAGYRDGNTIWAAAPPEPRPGTPCDASVGRRLQEDIAAFFRFESEGAAVAVLGLLGTAYLGAAARWRPSGFFWGPGGCGKSSLIKVLQACCPMNLFTNDTSKAGIEGLLRGDAKPIFVDEADTARDAAHAEAVVKMVLTASGDEGTMGARGDVNGGAREIRVAGCFLMAATAPPEMRSTLMGRILLLKMIEPEDGCDFKTQHAELTARMQKKGTELWGRALSAFERYTASLHVFRAGLQRVGCQPREMDQFGAIIAGWWILTHEGLPTASGVREGVGALAGLLRTADIVREESNARSLVQYLLSTAIQLDRSTDREPIANLIEIALHAGESSYEMERRVGLDDADRIRAIGTDRARRILATHGIRVIQKEKPPRAGDTSDPAPRAGKGAGIWFANTSRELRAIFDGSDWAGARWQSGLRELPSSKLSSSAIAFGALRSRAVWVSAVDLGIEPPEAAPEDELKPPW